MVVNASDVRAPEGLWTDEFVLRPIRASDAELDYEAVMESREFLRRWEQSSWPTDDFTVDANREDMDKLERRHTGGESFTYTVLKPSETQCLGCVYILPTTARWLSRAQITALDGAQWSAYEAAVLFWVRQSRLADGLDRRLLEALGPWLAHDWRFANPLVMTNEQVEQQVAMIEGAGLGLRFRLEYPNQPGNYLAYAGDASGRNDDLRRARRRFDGPPAKERAAGEGSERSGPPQKSPGNGRRAGHHSVPVLSDF